MALGKDYARQDCAVARALEVVGERWTMLIIRDALYGVRRFSDFLARLDIPRAVLSQRLQSLVDAGVLEKAGHEYVITETGKELWPVVHALARWGSGTSATAPQSACTATPDAAPGSPPTAPAPSAPAPSRSRRSSCARAPAPPSATTPSAWPCANRTACSRPSGPDPRPARRPVRCARVGRRGQAPRACAMSSATASGSTCWPLSWARFSW
ncbi:winged helix-turn-helix transcriptional regulator [Actinomadura keratinilytica]|uniref:winged helix-turn-helix transcriptional regulator n=1 Tax=Actinomadura keratinilytica TaxID=547461 RepID=UPI00361EAD74